jgi:hypothetical protein
VPDDQAKRTNPASAASAVHTCEATQDVADMLELDNGETLRLMHSRWEKLYTDLWSAKTEAFDMSKIPDIYDCCKYDAIHSQHSLGLTVLDEMYETARSLAEFVCPSEYGLSRSQRLKIGCTICRNLVRQSPSSSRFLVCLYRFCLSRPFLSPSLRLPVAVCLELTVTVFS